MSDGAEVGPEGVGDAEIILSPDPDGQPKRKRSRRGSRGGRKRRKPSTNGDQTAVATTEEVDGVEIAAVEPQDSGLILVAESTNVESRIPDLGPDNSEAPEYVPMSEWIEDFDTRPRA